MYSNCHHGNKGLIMVTRSGPLIMVTSQERGSRLNSFVIKRMFIKGDSSLSHTMTSVPGSNVLFRLKRNKGLVRNSM